LGSPTREFINKMNLREIGFDDDELDIIGSGSCPVVGFSISDVEPSGSAARELDSCCVGPLWTTPHRNHKMASEYASIN
jgi:hypothetical protein